MVDKAILTRIKALLAKATSSDHQAEAESFFAKAYEMMERYQVGTADLDQDDPVGAEKVCEKKGAASPDWDFRLMFGVSTYFGCLAIQIPTYAVSKRGIYEWSGHYMDLVGRESARITAIEMHKYLVATVRRLGRERAKEDDRLNADAWSRRIGVALYTRLYELAPKPEKAKTNAATANALTTTSQVQALYDKRHPDAAPIGGRGSFTNASARNLANGIGLNLQTGNSSTKRLA